MGSNLLGIKERCHSKELDAYGTSKIFKRRSDKISFYRNIITYLGFVVPLVVGAGVLAFSAGFLAYVFIPAGILMTIQLALSLWTMVAQWDSKYSYAIGSMQNNLKMSGAWKTLGENPPPNAEEKFKELLAEELRQEQSDLTQSITDADIRYGMRMSLYQHRETCVVCKIKPLTMKPGNCDTCGNF